MENADSYETHMKRARNSVDSAIWELEYYDRKGNAELIRKLRTGDLNNPTPEFLEAVVETGKPTAFEFLIEYKFPVDSMYDGRNIVLCLVLQKRKNNMLRYLVRERNADVNKKNASGEPPLLCAASLGDKYALDLLLDAGADVRAAGNDNWGRTVLHEVANHDRSPFDGNTIKKLLERGADVNALDEEGNSPLYLSIEKHNLEITKKLVECGADVNIRNVDGITPLHSAVLNEPDYHEFTELLLTHGGDIKAQDNNGDTPLHLSIMETRTAEINWRDWRENPWPDKADQYDVLPFLIEESDSESINIQNNDKETPLHLAAQVGSAEIVQALLNNGADISIRDNGGLTALDIAVKRNDSKIVNTFAVFSKRQTKEE